jgi:hypothetical protein
VRFAGQVLLVLTDAAFLELQGARLSRFLVGGFDLDLVKGADEVFVGHGLIDLGTVHYNYLTEIFTKPTDRHGPC